MGIEETSRDPQLAVRTVVVTTRAAVSAHLALGRTDLAREGVRRGMRLLDGVRRVEERGEAEADEATEELLEDARRELDALEAGLSDPSPR